MPHTGNVYEHPEYYDLAFSFRDFAKEVDVFEQCIERYSRIPVKRMLELASGTSPHLDELARRDYEYTGLDISQAMIDYSRKKAEALGVRSEFLRCDMRHFRLKPPVDFAYTMCGSLYTITTDDVMAHLRCVADALRSGGLYFLDWCVDFEWLDAPRQDQKWSTERNGIGVRFDFTREIVDRASQLCLHRLRLEIDDHGRNLNLESVDRVRVIFPQELLLLVEKSRAFEFIGWWNKCDLDSPMEQASTVDRPITLLRRL
jgi:SAM-dependent methyltransferase